MITINKNIFLQDVKVKYINRCSLLKQKGVVIWFTGLSGAGKTTIATQVEHRLFQEGYATYLLDGDNIRHCLNSDLGFCNSDRIENLRRIIEVAVLLKDAGLITLVSCISPFSVSREEARFKIGHDNFIEVYVKADINTCARRDTKGLYKRAKQGLIKDFTGLSSPYEEPSNPNIIIDTTLLTIDECKQSVVQELFNHQKII